MSVPLFLFFYVMGLLITGMAILIAVSVIRLWPGLSIPRAQLLRGWLLAALGFALDLAIFRQWSSPLLKDPDLLGLPSGFVVAAAGVLLWAGWSALVTFGVLRLRARGAWVFFAILGAIMIPMGTPTFG